MGEKANTDTANNTDAIQRAKLLLHSTENSLRVLGGAEKAVRRVACGHPFRRSNLPSVIAVVLLGVTSLLEGSQDVVGAGWHTGWAVSRAHCCLVILAVCAGVPREAFYTHTLHTHKQHTAPPKLQPQPLHAAPAEVSSLQRDLVVWRVRQRLLVGGQRVPAGQAGRQEGWATQQAARGLRTHGAEWDAAHTTLQRHPC